MHHERVTAFEPPHRYAVSMELAPPVSSVMARIVEEVLLEPAAGGTLVTRTFAVEPAHLWTAPVAWFFGGVLLPRAVARHDARVKAALEAP